MSKMKTYKFLKQSWKVKDYLLRTGNVSDRTALTKLRLSDHILAIEKGRHENINEPDRTCPFCPGQVEDEFHFLIKCPTFKYLRKSLIDDVEVLCIGFSYPQDQNFLMWLLLNNPIISDSTGKFIRSSMELRAFLLERHRNYDCSSDLPCALLSFTFEFPLFNCMLVLLVMCCIFLSVS